jgi:flagellar motor switch protein FliM
MIDISPAERRLNIQLDATWSSMQHLILPQSPLLPIMQSADTVLSKNMKWQIIKFLSNLWIQCQIADR